MCTECEGVPCSPGVSAVAGLPLNQTVVMSARRGFLGALCTSAPAAAAAGAMPRGAARCPPSRSRRGFRVVAIIAIGAFQRRRAGTCAPRQDIINATEGLVRCYSGRKPSDNLPL
jgi:hypothetical protein